MNMKKFYVKGMHCVSCEKLLEDEFSDISGVKKVKIDHIKGIGEIESGSEIDFSRLVSAAEKLGYKVYENEGEVDVDGIVEKNFASSLGEWIKAVLLVGLLLGVFKYFQSTGAIEKISFQDKNIGLGVAFLVGLVASLSSCLVIVGSVVVAFGEKYKSAGEGFYNKAIKPNLFFHVGRLSAFFILGGLLGLIGGQININGGFVSAFMIVIAAVMGWLGLSILVNVPSISRLGIGLPKNMTKKWSQLKKSDRQAAPFVLGALSFFLPCGFTQSMQIFALASGSFWAGGMTLLLFAAGTLPVLMTIGVASSWMKSKRVVVFQKVAGMLIVLFAFFTLQSGLALRGVDANFINLDKASISDRKEDVKPDGGNTEKQVVEMKVTSSGFSPSAIKLKKDVPVEWVIIGESITGCTSKIIVPSLNISQSLVSGQNVVHFTPTKTGTIPFSCWMGMVSGKFIVE
jgi:uncharacterized protein